MSSHVAPEPKKCLLCQGHVFKVLSLNKKIKIKKQHHQQEKPNQNKYSLPV